MQLPTAAPSPNAGDSLQVRGSRAALRGHGQRKRTSGGSRGGQEKPAGRERSWREEPGPGSTAPWGEFLEEDGEASPSPERLCPLVARKGAEAEEVAPVPAAIGRRGGRAVAVPCRRGGPRTHSGLGARRGGWDAPLVTGRLPGSPLSR